MDQQATVTTTQNFLLLNCSSEQYSINFSESLLSPHNTYTIQYAYPNKSTKGVVAEYVRDNQLLVKSPPEFDHPCTVHVEVYTNGNEQYIAKFSLDLVSPVEYLFRKYSLDNKMCSSDKMTSALLAMSLSYYCVMEEQMKKERKVADKILATLLSCSAKHITSVQPATSATDIKEFAKHHQLQHTLQCLPDAVGLPSIQTEVNGTTKENIKSSNTDLSQGDYTSLINMKNSNSGYAALTTVTQSDHYSLVTNSKQASQTAYGYEIPNTTVRRSAAFQPPMPHKKKLARSTSLDSIASKDHEYAYVDPSAILVSPSSPRLPPPRPPPPRKPNKPATPPCTKRLMSLGRTASDPSSPTNKKWWQRKDKAKQ